jgi:hypothetical protein
MAIVPPGPFVDEASVVPGPPQRTTAAGIPRICSTDHVTGNRDLLADQCRRAAPLLQHKERIRRLHIHVEPRSHRLGTHPIEVRQCRRPTMPADSRPGNLLLDRHADIRAAQRERKMVEGGRQHRILECVDDRGSRFRRATPRVRGLNLVSSLAGDSNDIA